jgi:cobalamin biosynthesis Mg chelatase CobN
MSSRAVMFLLLALIGELCIAQTVTIKKDIPSDAHKCVTFCLTYPGFQDDLGSALACGAPYKNDCYCATEVGSASKASSWIERCAKEQCLAGDLNKDRTSIQNIYSGYCKGAGLPQPTPQSVSATATLTVSPSSKTEVSSWPSSTSLNSSDGGTQPSETDNAGPTLGATTQTTVVETTVVMQTKGGSASVGSPQAMLFLLGVVVSLLLVQVIPLCMNCKHLIMR